MDKPPPEPPSRGSGYAAVDEAALEVDDLEEWKAGVDRRFEELTKDDDAADQAHPLEQLIPAFG